jgi:hypothetical protein
VKVDTYLEREGEICACSATLADRFGNGTLEVGNEQLQWKASFRAIVDDKCQNTPPNPRT